MRGCWPSIIIWWLFFLRFVFALQEMTTMKSLQLHPKIGVFQSDQPDANINQRMFCHGWHGIGRVWLSYYPVFFFQTERTTDFNVQIRIENLFKYNARKLMFSIEALCSVRFNDKSRLRLKLSNEVVICREFSATKVKIMEIDWSPERGVLLLGMSIKRSAEYHSNSPFFYYQSFQLTIKEDLESWSLKTGGIYIFRWNWLSFSAYKDYISKTGLSLLTNASLPPLKKFGTTQFLAEPILYLLKTAPEFMRSIISIGAKVLYGVGSGIYFLSLGRPPTTESRFTGLAIARINATSGNIHYSMMGLRFAIEESQLSDGKVKPSCTGGRKDCVHVTVMAKLENLCVEEEQPYNEMMTYSKEVDHKHMEVYGNLNDCEVIKSPVHVFVFARLPQYISCPILCANPHQEFFYQDPYNKIIGRTDKRKVTNFNEMLSFGPEVSHSDSGNYVCLAGNKKAIINVQIVSLPDFGWPQTRSPTGYLPKKIVVMPGDGYSVNCTVFYSNMKQSVNLDYIFHVIENRRNPSKIWIPTTGGAIRDIFGRHIRVTEHKNSSSITLTVTVTKVPDLTKDYDFSHRFECVATASHFDSKRFGLRFPYKVHSGTDVLLATRPVSADFVLNIKDNCCRMKCSTSCYLAFSLSQSLQRRLKLLGIKVKGKFVSPSAKQGNLLRWLKQYQDFRPSTTTLTWFMPTEVAQLDSIHRKAFAELIAVFSLFDPMAETGGTHTRVVRLTSFAGSPRCQLDKGCLYTTELDPALGDTLSVAKRLNITQAYLDSLPKFKIQEESVSKVSDNSKDADKRKLLNKLINTNAAAVVAESGALATAAAAVVGCLASAWPLHFVQRLALN